MYHFIHWVCLVPNKVDFVVLMKMYTQVVQTKINYQQITHTNAVVTFQFQLCYYIGKLSKYHQHKVTNN